MVAGTAVILSFSFTLPPPSAAAAAAATTSAVVIDTVLRRRLSFSAGKSASFSAAPLNSFFRRSSRFPVLNAAQLPSQGSFDGNSNGAVLTSPSVLDLAKGFLNFLVANLLPIALVAGVVLGIKSPGLGCLGYRYSLSKYMTSWLFFMSGMKLEDGDIKGVLEAWPAFLFGLVSILLLCPLFAKLILKVPLVPKEFVTGLAIFGCMPTTLNGGVALTQLVGGNSALALALTVMSVLLSILIVPLWITKFVADGFGLTIPTWPLFQSLLLTLIVPLILGKVIRNSVPGVATSIDQNERLISFSTSILLGFFPWMQVSQSRSLLMQVKPEVFVCAIALGILVHVIFLVFNAILVRGLSMVPWAGKSVFAKKGNSRALMLVCSQRSLLIATTVVEQLGGVLGQSGLLVLPCVAADVNQIIVDSLLVNFWLQKDEPSGIVEKP
ncbi:hypothetical protein vseg_004134 [Gypsophila vaccaria]